MNEADAFNLRQVLVGYFGDQTREEGIQELLGVTLQDEATHHRYRTALEAGVDAARAGDEDAFYTARELRPFLLDVAAAADLIASILSDYDKQYEARRGA